MKTIWKFELAVTDSQTVSMPVNAEILTVQIQNGVPCMWALVNTDNDEENREIVTRRTGHAEAAPVPAKYQYIGTYQTGSLAFHVFHGYSLSL